MGYTSIYSPPGTGGALELATWTDRDTTLADGTEIRVNDGPVLALAKTYHAEVILDTFDASTTYRITINGINYDEVNPTTSQNLMNNLEAAIHAVSGIEAVTGDDSPELWIYSNTEFTISVSIVSGAGTWLSLSTQTVAEYVPIAYFARGIIWERILDTNETLPTIGPLDWQDRWAKSEVGTGTVTPGADYMRIQVTAGTGSRAQIRRTNSKWGLRKTNDSRILFVEIKCAAAGGNWSYACAAGPSFTSGDIEETGALLNGTAMELEGIEYPRELFAYDYSTGQNPVWQIGEEGGSSNVKHVFYGHDGNIAGTCEGASFTGLSPNEERIGVINNTIDDLDLYIYKAVSGRIGTIA